MALVSLILFGEMVGNWIRCHTELQTATAALSRVRGFEEDVPREDDEKGLAGKGKTLEEWPSSGGIESNSVAASYE